MFFIGKTAATVNLSNIQSDLIGLLTGTITAPNGLSSSWVQANCNIVSTVAPGWTLADAAAGTAVNGVTPKVITAPWSDDVSKFKPLKIGGELSATGLSLAGYESWNTTTHVGTNIHKVPAVSGWGNFLIIANNWIIISASTNHIAIFNYSTALTGNATCASFFLSEYSREDAWNTVANGYPAWFTSGNTGAATVGISILNTGLALGRLPNLNVADAIDILSPSSSPLVSSQFARIMPVPTAVTGSGYGIGIESVGNMLCGSGNLDSNKVWGYPLFPLRLNIGPITTPIGGAHMFGSINAKSPFIYSTVNQNWNTGDEIVINGVTYCYINIGSNFSTPLLIKEQ